MSLICPRWLMKLLISLIFVLVSFSLCAIFPPEGENEYEVLINEEGREDIPINVQDHSPESIQQGNDSEIEYVNHGNCKFCKMSRFDILCVTILLLLFMIFSLLIIIGVSLRLGFIKLHNSH